MSILDHATYGKNDFVVESRESAFNGFIQVEKVTLRHRLFDQNDYIDPAIQRELIHRKEAAGVLLYDDEHQQFALIEQFRVGALKHPEGPWQLEIIAGVLDADESPEECLIREAFEESGCQIERPQHLYSFYPSAGACSEYFHLYAAETNLSGKKGNFGVANEGEDIKLHVIDYAHLEHLLQHGRLQNAPVIMALQWLRQHLSVHKGML